MTFIWIEMLWLLLLVPLLVIGYLLIQRRRKKYALRYASLSTVKEALGRGPGIRRHIPPILFLVGVTVMIFALSRPAATLTLPSQQSTVILTIDVSGSMQAQDIKPSRLEAAKAAARSFIEKQPGYVLIGVVSFSDMAAVVQAPTKDRELVLAAINRLTPQRGTAVGQGMLTSLNAIFEDPSAKPAATPSRDLLALPDPKTVPPPVPPGSYTQAVIILLSDGESNVGFSPLDIADKVADRGVRVYTIGVGSPEGTVLRIEGRSIRVRLDEDTLKKIAEKTAANYYKADNEAQLRTVYENLSSRIVFKTEQTEITAGFTALAALLLLVAGTLSLLWFSRLP